MGLCTIIQKNEKFMNRQLFYVFCLLVSGIVVAESTQAWEGCTSAVIGPNATAERVPVLWKNRDTDHLSNKVIYVKDTPHSYLGIANANVPSGRQVFAGLNSAGFGIMNTVASNLPKKSGEMEDLEGIVMADALRICQTVEDFEQYITANLGPALGSWANFGVFDACGKACLFEVHNHGYEKIDVAKANGHYLVNTNFARSGTPGKGDGYLRCDRACQLFEAFEPNRVDFKTILTRHTRDLGHAILDQPGIDSARTIPASRALWIFTRDCINRPSTASAVVIVGKKPSEPNSVATLWVIPGEPVTAIAIPLWVEAGSSPTPLWEGKKTSMWTESLRIKKMIRPNIEGNKGEYLNLTQLENADGTGFLSTILQAETSIIAETMEFLQQRHAPEEYAAFQNALTERALATLRSIR
jgi:hypothetical protein